MYSDAILISTKCHIRIFLNNDDVYTATKRSRYSTRAHYSSMPQKGIFEYRIEHRSLPGGNGAWISKWRGRSSYLIIDNARFGNVAWLTWRLALPAQCQQGGERAAVDPTIRPTHSRRAVLRFIPKIFHKYQTLLGKTDIAVFIRACEVKLCWTIQFKFGIVRRGVKANFSTMSW